MGAAGALECDSLLPLSSSELARALEAGIGQQAGRLESGSKLPHSKAVRGRQAVPLQNS